MACRGIEWKRTRREEDTALDGNPEAAYLYSVTLLYHDDGQFAQPPQPQRDGMLILQARPTKHLH